MSRIGECESGRTWNGFRVEGGKAGEGVKFERIRRIHHRVPCRHGGAFQ